MKYSEFHKLIKERWWKYVSASGSHYFYEKMELNRHRFLFSVQKRLEKVWGEEL